MNENYFINVTDADLLELAAERRPELQVGTVPYEVRKYLGCSRDTAFLSSESIKHIMLRHGDHICNEHLRLLPQILFQGLWLGDERTTHAIVTCQVSEIRYKAVVKVTRDRSRTYVKTLHRLAKRQTRSLMNRAKVLREAW